VGRQRQAARRRKKRRGKKDRGGTDKGMQGGAMVEDMAIARQRGPPPSRR